MQRGLLTIKEFAQLCRSTPRTLRLYEELGLIKPRARAEWSRYRLYEPSQGRLFFKIRLLQNFKVPLKEISKILRVKTPEDYLSQQITALRQEIEEKQKEYKFLKTFNKFYFEDQDLAKIVKKETVGPFTIFGHIVEREHYHQITPDMQDLARLSDKLGFKFKRTPKSVAIYLEQEKYKPLNTKMKLGMVLKTTKVRTQKKLPDGYFLETFPKTQIYSYTYKGPYEFITLVFEKLHELNITNKLPVRFEAFDLYLDDYLIEKSHYDLTTKICFPLK